jgi:hypothetical protein
MVYVLKNDEQLGACATTNVEMFQSVVGGSANPPY